MAMARETGRWLIASGRAPDLREEGSSFAPAPLAFAAMRDGSSDALAALDTAVERLTQSGRLLALHEQWLSG
jgi:ABC-type amino acid transport substrate-binding protein